MKQIKYFFYFIYTVILFSSTNILSEINYKSDELECKKQITITIPLKNDELLYADSLALEVDHPAFVIKDITTTQSPTSIYDSTSKENKKVFENQVTVTATIEYQPSPKVDYANIHVIYTTNKQPYPLEKLIPLSFTNSTEQKELQAEIPPSTQPKVQKQQPPKKVSHSFSEYISYLLETSNSLTFQLLLAFLLGVLLSLTPCIYPMIPITVGILHNYGTKSFLGNTVRAILYSMGIATTYALFGLLASCSGPLCGYLLAKPIFVYMLVAFLVYLAGSMLGLYELYIPRFMQAQQKLQARSLWSVFLFGIVSGTIASPCVSPGLALILGIVATLGNKFLGFLILFLFGVGLSMPLLIVGTFSSSLTLLPRAGLWMVEIKKVFGFLLLALCIYYLTTILPHNIILLISAITVAGSGILYLFWAQKMHKKSWKKGYNIIGTLLIAGSVTLFIKAAQETLFPSRAKEESELWLKDLDQAFIIAQQQHKLIFVDIWAQFCSICLAINNSILANEKVLQAFEKEYILIKANGTSSALEPYATLQQHYNITGFPTFLIINPHTQEVIQRWGSEIYTMPKEDFIENIKKHYIEFRKSELTANILDRREKMILPSVHMP